MATKIRLDFGYDGAEFRGWQTQPAQLTGQLAGHIAGHITGHITGHATVQGTLEAALEIYLRGLSKKQSAEIPEKIFIQGSGRTDRGVHARRQVASFTWPEALPFHASRVRDALNALTPASLAVQSVSEVPVSFDARHSPHTKCYAYRWWTNAAPASLDRGQVSWVARPLHVGAMIDAARIFAGQHDFSGFRAADCSAKTTIRTVLRSEIVRVSASELRFQIVGKGFLKQMVRIIAGGLLEVGKGSLTVDALWTVLRTGEKQKLGNTAPAQGLTLEWVRYGDLTGL